MILALETATLTASVAVWDEREGRARAALRDRVTTHSERLLPLVDEALRAAGVAAEALDAIACGAGPGSFTGLRIGLATAKGLCLALGKPLVMVSSLQALAARAAPGAAAVGCLDAFKGEVYAGFFRGGDPPAPVAAEVVAPASVVAARIRELFDDRAVYLFGDGPARWRELAAVDGAVCDERPPDAAEVARLAAHRVARGDFDDLAAAAPRYIRPSEAEINFPKKD